MTGHGRGLLRDALREARAERASQETCVERAREELRLAEVACEFWGAECAGLENSLKILQEAWEAAE
jgi:hypothetical protein